MPLSTSAPRRGRRSGGGAAAGASPGILIGALLTFVLSFGAVAESGILGGRSVVVIAQAIEQRFSYAQDWPLGSALTVSSR
jgi:spermidine/putrescine transport system permease protein